MGGWITHGCLLETVLEVAITWSRERDNYHNLAAMYGATLTTVEKSILMKIWGKYMAITRADDRLGKDRLHVQEEQFAKLSPEHLVKEEENGWVCSFFFL